MIAERDVWIQPMSGRLASDAACDTPDVVAAIHVYTTATDREHSLDCLAGPDEVTLRSWPAVASPPHPSSYARWTDGPFMRGKCVANAWQESQRAPFVINGVQRVSAGQTHNADYDQPRPLSAPRFPWYY